MNQVTIDIKNGTQASKLSIQNVCRTSYGRVVKFVDDKKHTLPMISEEDLLHVLG